MMCEYTIFMFYHLYINVFKHTQSTLRVSTMPIIHRRITVSRIMLYNPYIQPGPTEATEYALTLFSKRRKRKKRVSVKGGEVR